LLTSSFPFGRRQKLPLIERRWELGIAREDGERGNFSGVEQRENTKERAANAGFSLFVHALAARPLEGGGAPLSRRKLEGFIEKGWSVLY